MDEATKLLLELDKTISCIHLDMGGKHTYALSHKSNPIISKIKLYLSDINELGERIKEDESTKPNSKSTV